ncbi:hypothetical protein G6680_08315 [Polynucleobacter paneuropaeus]|jgi:hypothetical protein|nr:hypothetical protein [Polynucleobacter paneuropaeus]
MGKVTYRGMAPPDSPIYDQPMQIGGLQGKPKVVPIKSTKPDDSIYKKLLIPPKPIDKPKK